MGNGKWRVIAAITPGKCPVAYELAELLSKSQSCHLRALAISRSLSQSPFSQGKKRGLDETIPQVPFSRNCLVLSLALHRTSDHRTGHREWPSGCSQPSGRPYLTCPTQRAGPAQPVSTWAGVSPATSLPGAKAPGAPPPSAPTSGSPPICGLCW